MNDPNENIDSAPISSTLDEVTLFEDTENVVSYSNSTTDVIYEDDPYEDQDLERVLSRPWPIFTAVWSNTSTTNLFAVRPLQQLLENPFNANKLSGFAFIRSDIEIEVRINSTLMHSGMLLFTYNLQNVAYPSIFNQTTLPSYIVSANEQTTLKFTIPYAQPFDWWDIQANNNDAQPRLSCKVLAPLNSIAASSAVDMTVFARFVNPKVAGLITAQSEMGLDHINTEEFDSSSGILIEKFGSTSLDALTKQVAYDKPGCNQTLPALKPYSMSPLAVVHGVDASIKLSMDPDIHCYDHYSQFGDKADMSHFSNYIRIPYFVGDTSFDDQFVPKQKILDHGVTPFLYDDTDPQLIVMSPVGAIATQFRYWKGSMKYCLVFVCNSFVSARVAITWQPHMYPVGDGVSDKITKVFDIKGTTKVCFSIPYLQKEPWNTTGGNNGVFTLRVLNRATTASLEPGATTINTLLFAAGGESMSFARPGTVVNLGIPTYQTGVSYDGIMDLHELFRMPFEPLIPAVETQRFGSTNAESVNSWIDLNRRYTSLVPNGTQQYSLWRNTTQALTFMLSAFLYSKGSHRYKLRTAGSQESTVVVLDQALRGPEQRFAEGLNACANQLYKINEWIEVDVPFYYDLHYISSSGTTGLFQEQPGIFVNGPPIEMYVALGEDFAVGFPIPLYRTKPLEP